MIYIISMQQKHSKLIRIVLYHYIIMNCGTALPKSIVPSKIPSVELLSTYKRSTIQSHLTRRKEKLPFLLEHILQYSVSVHSQCLIYFFFISMTWFSDNPFMILSSRLVLFDIVLITIRNERYFGIIVYVDINEIASHTTNMQMNDTNFNVNLMTTIHVYVSYQCAAAFKEQSNENSSKYWK